MTEKQASGSERTASTPQSDDVIASVVDVGDSMVRFSLMALTWPSVFLPEEMRKDVRSTTSELASAIGRLHRNVAVVAVGAIGNAARAVSQPEQAPDSPAPADGKGEASRS